VTPGLVSLHYEAVACASGGTVFPYLFGDTSCGSELTMLDFYKTGTGFRCLSTYASKTIASLMLSCNKDTLERPQATSTISVNHVATGAAPAWTSTAGNSGSSGGGGKANDDPNTVGGWNDLSLGTRIGIIVAAGVVALCLCVTLCLRLWRSWKKPAPRFDQQYDHSMASLYPPTWKAPGSNTQEVTRPISGHHADSPLRPHPQPT
jgi:hypothetical protein